MAALILPSRRVVQPQGPAGIDWANPLTKGLKKAISAANGWGGRDLVDGTAYQALIGGAVYAPVVASKAGLAFKVERALYNSQLSLQSWANSTSEASALILRFAPTVATSSILWELGSSSQIDNFPFSGNAFTDAFWSSRWLNSVAPPGGKSFTEPMVIGVSVKNGSQRAFWDGRLWHTNTLSGGFTLPTNLTLGSDSTNSSAHNTEISGFFAWDRALSDSELSQVSQNPWQLFRPIQRRIWVPVAGGGGDVTGSLNATETGSDTFASSGTVLVSGALSVTESGSDTFSSSGAVVVSGSLAVTESGPDTFAASGLLGTSGSLSVTESGPDTFSATGTTTGGVSGSLDATEAGSDTVAVSGVVVVAGSLAVTESGAETFAASGAVVVAGLLNATESGPDTFAAVGFGGAVTGSLNATESGSDTFFATEEGQLIDTHDGFWAKEWKRIRAREKRKYQEEIQERVEEIQDEIAEVEQQIVEVKQAPKPKKATPARDFYAEQARIVEHLIARRNQLIDEEDEELLLLL